MAQQSHGAVTQGMQAEQKELVRMFLLKIVNNNKLHRLGGLFGLVLGFFSVHQLRPVLKQPLHQQLLSEGGRKLNQSSDPTLLL